MRALDLAIECLEQKLTSAERSKALAEIEAGRLKPQISQVCLGRAE